MAKMDQLKRRWGGAACFNKLTYSALEVDLMEASKQDHEDMQLGYSTYQRSSEMFASRVLQKRQQSPKPPGQLSPEDCTVTGSA
jgi:hypothetical protein